MRKIIYWLVIIILVFCITGKLLDMEAERVVHQLYPRDKQGVIEGLQPIIVNNGADKALVLIHGFMSSPDAYTDLINDIKNKKNMDIYAPLLPFHGRDLAAAAQLDDQKTEDYVQQYLNDLSKKYQSLTVVGFSFGGAILVDLARKNELPKNINLILYSPAVFIKANTSFGSFSLYAYALWRNYCNYAALNCASPSYESSDTTGKSLIDKEKTLRYVVTPAFKGLYKMDSENREWMSHINRPYSIIMAADDNRVSYKQQKAACDANKQYCHFYSFPSGRHFLHWGENKKAFEDLLLKLLKLTNNK